MLIKIENKTKKTLCLQEKKYKVINSSVSKGSWVKEEEEEGTAEVG